MDNAVGLQKRKLGLYPRDSTVETIKAVLERCKYLAWYHLRKAENKINASLYGLFIFQDRRIEILLVLEYFAKEFIDIVILVSWLEIIFYVLFNWEGNFVEYFICNFLFQCICVILNFFFLSDLNIRDTEKYLIKDLLFYFRSSSNRRLYLLEFNFN